MPSLLNESLNHILKNEASVKDDFFVYLSKFWENLFFHCFIFPKTLTKEAKNCVSQIIVEFNLKKKKNLMMGKTAMPDLDRRWQCKRSLLCILVRLQEPVSVPSQRKSDRTFVSVLPLMAFHRCRKNMLRENWWCAVPTALFQRKPTVN